MPQPRVLILRAPGTNCDGETAHAFTVAGGLPDAWHVNRLLDERDLLARYQILCLPGGFSYGDDIASGKILANQIRHHLADALKKFRDDGKLILGICNGFQILVKSGVLLADDDHGSPATLAWNTSRRFEDRWVNLRVSGDRCVFLRDIEEMYLPVAHGEGRFVARTGRALDQLESAGQLPLRYAGARELVGASATGGHQLPYPENPNGAERDVAGVCDESGRVFGLMPHPERHIDPTQHPRWTRGEARTPGDGLQVFVNAVRYFE